MRRVGSLGNYEIGFLNLINLGQHGCKNLHFSNPKLDSNQTVIDANCEHFQNTFIENLSKIHFKHYKNKSKHWQNICELLNLYNCFYIKFLNA